MRTYYTYILSSRPYGTLYVGVTNGLVHRVHQHRSGEGSAFTSKYNVCQLVWYTAFNTAEEAIQREKALKEWPRQWKINLIERDNPHWHDLFSTLPGAGIIDKLDHAKD